MAPEDKTVKIRRKPGFKVFMEEIKFLRSFRDVKYLLEKARFLMPRLLGTVDSWRDVPPSLLIEPTLFCNIDCTTCCRSKCTRTPGFMDLALFRKIIDDASRIGVGHILLYFFGEPLMHPGIVEMIRYIKSKGLAFHLTTNGSLLDDKMGEGILRSGVTSADYLTFSILGFSKEVHEKIMRGINHEQVVANVLNFMEKRTRSGINGPVVETVFYSTPENGHELKPFRDYWNGIVDHAVDGGKAVEAFIDPKLPKNPRTKTCHQLWERMAIYWNGDVTICGEDLNGDYVVGNLRDQSIREIWSGNELNRVRKLHKEGQYRKIPLCEFCDW